MPRYRVRFYAEDSGWVYFDAENLADAESVFESLQNGDLDTDDLQNGYKSWKNGSSEFSDLESVA